MRLQAFPKADFVALVEIESAVYNVSVLKRPGVDDFLLQMSTMFEIVVFTASLATVPGCTPHRCASQWKSLGLAGTLIVLHALLRHSSRRGDEGA